MFRLLLLSTLLFQAASIMPHEINDPVKLAQVNMNAQGYMEEQSAQGLDALSEAGTQFSMIMRKLEDFKAKDAASPDGLIVGTTPLSPTCATLNCDFFYYYLTCKQFNVQMDHICASYFVGWLFSCDGYPGQTTIQNAPSVCLGQFAEKALPLLLDAANQFANVTGIASYEESCQHNCFQNYMRSATVFLNDCYYQFEDSPPPTNALQALYALSAYYGTSCAVGTVTTAGVATPNTNCFDTLIQLQSNPSPAIPGYIMPFDNYWCNSTTPMGFYCPFGFEMYGCCYSNIVTLAEQIVKSNHSLVILPPCVQRYLYVTDCTASLTESFCTNGTNTNTTISQGSIRMMTAPIDGFPNVYSADSVLLLQEAITAGLMSNPAVATQVMLAIGPNIQISNYTYYSANGTALTPADGIAPDDMSDYTDAKSVAFWYNVVQVYSNEERALANTAWMSTQEFATVLATAYTLNVTDIEVYAENPNPFVYTQEPFDTTHYNNAGSSSTSLDKVMAFAIIMTTALAMIMM